MNLNRCVTLVVLFLLALIGVQAAYGEGLTPVGVGFDPWALVLGLALVAVVTGLVLWHRRHPTTDAVPTPEIHALLGKVHEELVQARASVIKWTAGDPGATPPVSTPPGFDPSPYQKTYRSKFELAVDALRVTDGRAVVVYEQGAKVILKVGTSPEHVFRSDPATGLVNR